jgi:hypothetical protein
MRRRLLAFVVAGVLLAGTAARADAGTVTPNPVAFGNVSVGTTKALVVTITPRNPNKNTVERYFDATITGSPRFTISTNTCGGALQCSITVAFAPTAAQFESGTLVITFDDINLKNGTETFPTVSVSLTGTGVGAPPPQVAESVRTVGFPLAATAILFAAGVWLRGRRRKQMA